jgi:hypothetical protein
MWVLPSFIAEKEVQVICVPWMSVTCNRHVCSTEPECLALCNRSLKFVCVVSQLYGKSHHIFNRSCDICLYIPQSSSSYYWNFPWHIVLLFFSFHFPSCVLCHSWSSWIHFLYAVNMPWRHRVWVEVQLYSFLTSVVEGGGQLMSHPDLLKRTR